MCLTPTSAGVETVVREVTEECGLELEAQRNSQNNLGAWGLIKTQYVRDNSNQWITGRHLKLFRYIHANNVRRVFDAHPKKSFVSCLLPCLGYK